MLLDPWPKLFGLLATGFVACQMASTDVYGQTPAADPTLVLHHSFDQDTGETATDRSSYGNHGKVVETRHLEEVKGHRGVLRFDNEKSVLQCPDSDSLFFEGDLSFEMWVRLNG